MFIIIRQRYISVPAALLCFSFRLGLLCKYLSVRLAVLFGDVHERTLDP